MFELKPVPFVSSQKARARRQASRSYVGKYKSSAETRACSRLTFTKRTGLRSAISSRMGRRQSRKICTCPTALNGSCPVFKRVARRKRRPGKAVWLGRRWLSTRALKPFEGWSTKVKSNSQSGVRFSSVAFHDLLCGYLTNLVPCR